MEIYEKEEDALNPDGDGEALDTEEQALEDERITKAEELAKNYKIRAEKAEKALKLKETEKKVDDKKSTAENYSLSDIRALNDVHDEDVEEIVEYAKFKGILISEAKKSKTIEVFLKERAEERRTAEAANVGKAKRGSTSNSEEKLLNDFESGILPDENDLEKLAKARMERRKAAIRRT